MISTLNACRLQVLEHCYVWHADKVDPNERRSSLFFPEILLQRTEFAKKMHSLKQALVGIHIQWACIVVWLAASAYVCCVCCMRIARVVHCVVPQHGWNELFTIMDSDGSGKVNPGLQAYIFVHVEMVVTVLNHCFLLDANR